MNPLSGVLGEAWGMYRTYAKHLLAIAFVIYLIAAIVAAVLSLAGTFGALLGSLVSIIAAYLLQATLVKAVQDVRDGRVDMSIGETVQAARPFLWSVVGASILAGIAITIGLILIIAPGLYLITIWAVIVPVIVIEGSGAMASFGRSRQLVRGHGWHVFGTLVLVYIILIVVGFVLAAIFSALPHVLSSGLSQVIAGTLISPFLALVVTLVYYRLVGAAVPSADGGNYGGYAQPPQNGGAYGGWPQQPQQPQGPPAPVAGENYGGYNQPPQSGQNYPGYNQPPQSGQNYPGYNQPPQSDQNYGSYSQPPQPDQNYGGYNQPPQPDQNYGGYSEPTRQYPRQQRQQPPAPDEDHEDDNYGGYRQPLSGVKELRLTRPA
jgi:hypothetical protein